MVVCLTAVVCILYSFSLEQRRMIGDEAGHDPGSRAMPLTAGVLMLTAGLYEVFKRSAERKPPKEAEDKPASFLGLFLLTLGCSIGYIVLLEAVGFVLLTSIFLYLLFSAYSRIQDEESRAITAYIPGLLLTIIVTTAVYAVGRYLSRQLFYWGRSIGSAAASSRTATILLFTLSSGLLYAGLFAAAAMWSKRRPGRKGIIMSVFLSAGTTLFLYIVFRMVFRVNFPAGPIYG